MLSKLSHIYNNYKQTIKTKASLIITAFKPKTYTLEDFDLSQTTQLKFTKTEYGEYNVERFHPLYKERWTLPEWNAWIHARRSLLSHWSFWGYSLNKLECSYENIGRMKKRFQTIWDINNYLKKFENDYEDFIKYKQEQNKKPDVIY